MPHYWTILILLGLVSAPVLLVAAWSRHLKSSSGTIQLVGVVGTSVGALDPHGFVRINGELWAATLANGDRAGDATQIIVTGSKSIRLEVRLLAEPAA